jgi:hypothetical protein
MESRPMRSAIETEQNIVRVANRPAMGQFDSASADPGTDSFSDVLRALFDAQKLRLSGEVRLPTSVLTLAGGDQASATAPTIAPKATTANSRALAGLLSTDLTSEAVNAVSANAIASAINAAATLAESTSAAPVAADTLAAPSPTAPAAPTAAPLAAATSASAVTSMAAPATAPAPAANVGAATAASNPLAGNFLLNAADQALANITQNPAYAAIAASLYVSVAAYRPQDPSVMAVPDRSDTPKPPNGISALQEVDTEGQETGYQHPRGGNRARAYLA